MSRDRAGLLLLLFCTACSSSAPLADRLVACGLVTTGARETELAEGLLYAPTDCYRDCLAHASCEELSGRLCGTDLAVSLRCDRRCAYACADGGRVAPNARCNGIPDCADGSDESGCPMYTCADGMRLPQASHCNGYVECSGGGDEADCPGYCETTWGGRYLIASVRCNGSIDCLDAQDEAGCATYTCSAGMVVTYDPAHPIRCDGITQCWYDGLDEVGCPPPAMLTCPM